MRSRAKRRLKAEMYTSGENCRSTLPPEIKRHFGERKYIILYYIIK